VSGYEVGLLADDVHSHLGKVGFRHRHFAPEYLGPIGPFEEGMRLYLSCSTFCAQSLCGVFLEQLM